MKLFWRWWIVMFASTIGMNLIRFVYYPGSRWFEFWLITLLVNVIATSRAAVVWWRLLRS